MSDDERQTALLHGVRWPTGQFRGTQPGIFNASTVLFANSAAFRGRDWSRKDGFIYGPHGTPTTLELQARLAQLEGAEHCLLSPSGLSAIALVYLALLKPGDEVLVPINVYHAHRTLLVEDLVAWGIQIRLYDPTQPDSLDFRECTRLVWIEAPCSITFEFPDVPAITALARQNGVLCAIDNTWGAGIALQPFELGVDISIQSLSKFAAGSGDVVMGAVTCRDSDIYEALRSYSMRAGLGVSSMDSAAVCKGLDTLVLRYHAQDATARTLIRALEGERAVAEVLHPSLPSCSGHEYWARDCKAAAGTFSLVFHESISQADVDRFLDALRLVKIGFGWGGPLSLAVPYGRSVAGVRTIPGELVRFGIGLESANDLLADLRQALRTLPDLSA